MNLRFFRPSPVAFFALAVPVLAPIAVAAPTKIVVRGSALRANAAPCPSPECYSVEVPIVTRVVGTAFFRTAIDISNNTSSGTMASPVVAKLQYCYNRTTPAGFFCTSKTNPVKVNLLAFDSFHQDDIVQYLGSVPGALEPGAAESSYGTLLVNFEGLPSAQGWEGTVFARTYSPNPTGGGTVAIAYPASLFFESAHETLVATIRDTQTAPPSVAGTLRTNIGIRNTDAELIPSGQKATVTLEFYDVTFGSPTNGLRVGNVITLSNLQPGEVRQINDIRVAAAIPDGVTAMLAFADVVGATATTPTIEGYVNIMDGGTQDGAFFEMKCARGCLY